MKLAPRDDGMPMPRPAHRGEGPSWDINEQSRGPLIQQGVIPPEGVRIFPSVVEPVKRYLRERKDQRRPTIEIGDSLFIAVEGIDSTKLVPLREFRSQSAADHKKNEAAYQAALMAGQPIGAGAYGIASAFGASDGVRSFAYSAGSLMDALLIGGFRFGGSARPVGPPPQRLASPTVQKPAIRITSGEKGTRATSTVTKDQLGTGTRAPSSAKPPGWQDVSPGVKVDQERGHLIAKVLGGRGEDPGILATMTRRTNLDMWQIEKIVRDAVKKGSVVDYSVLSMTDSPKTSPSAIIMTGTGSRGESIARVILVKKARQP